MYERTVGDGPPLVGIIMGSDSDWKTMSYAAQVLDELEVSYETRVVSAHRSPDRLYKYAREAESRGLSLIIAGAGGAAHLPGMTASMTILPVVGVPVIATPLGGLDALLSIMQMPAEVGVATMSVGEKGAKSAALFAATALACRSPTLLAELRNRRGATLGRIPNPDACGKVVILAETEQDLKVLKHAEDYLSELDVPFEKVVCGPTMEGSMKARQITLEAEGPTVFIAGSGCERRIRFACEVAKSTDFPVLGVPIVYDYDKVSCVDSFLQPFLEMPPGVATFAVNKPGAINAALFAATIISERGTKVWQELHQMRKRQEKRVEEMDEALPRGGRCEQSTSESGVRGGHHGVRSPEGGHAIHS